MNNHQMANSMIHRAEAILDEARYLYQKRRWNLVVRRCDVGPILRREKRRFPDWFQVQIPRLTSISRRLRLEREVSFYGDEQSGIPAEELYNEMDARWALEETQWVLDTCKRLLTEDTS